jgi:hypothetical protein
MRCAELALSHRGLAAGLRRDPAGSSGAQACIGCSIKGRQRLACLLHEVVHWIMMGVVVNVKPLARSVC